MYHDQSIKPLRDSNRLYYAAITTIQLIGCYRKLSTPTQKRKVQERRSTTGYHTGAEHCMLFPRRSAEEDPAWVIGNSPAELRADSRKD